MLYDRYASYKIPGAARKRMDNNCAACLFASYLETNGKGLLLNFSAATDVTDQSKLVTMIHTALNLKNDHHDLSKIQCVPCRPIQPTTGHRLKTVSTQFDTLYFAPHHNIRPDRIAKGTANTKPQKRITIALPTFQPINNHGRCPTPLLTQVSQSPLQESPPPTQLPQSEGPEKSAFTNIVQYQQQPRVRKKNQRHKGVQQPVHNNWTQLKPTQQLQSPLRQPIPSYRSTNVSTNVSLTTICTDRISLKSSFKTQLRNKQDKLRAMAAAYPRTRGSNDREHAYFTNRSEILGAWTPETQRRSHRAPKFPSVSPK